jgi:predicted RNase H-like HicB family nuclease
VKSYVFRVVLEEDEGRWHAAVPELEAKGGATWGNSREEALRNIQEVVQMVLEDLIEEGEPVPVGIAVTDEPAVAVTVR